MKKILYILINFLVICFFTYFNYKYFSPNVFSFHLDNIVEIIIVITLMLSFLFLSHIFYKENKLMYLISLFIFIFALFFITGNSLLESGTKDLIANCSYNMQEINNKVAFYRNKNACLPKNIEQIYHSKKDIPFCPFSYKIYHVSKSKNRVVISCTTGNHSIWPKTYFKPIITDGIEWKYTEEIPDAIEKHKFSPLKLQTEKIFYQLIFLYTIFLVLGCFNDLQVFLSSIFISLFSYVFIGICKGFFIDIFDFSLYLCSYNSIFILMIWVNIFFTLLLFFLIRRFELENPKVF